MDNLVSVNPGLMIWTIINFSLFLFIVIKFFAKPIMGYFKARENRIASEITNAEKINHEAQKLLKLAQSKVDASEKEHADIVADARKQYEHILHKATEDSDIVKNNKVKEALREIDRSKDAALKELRTEVADLVINATERILQEKLDPSRDMKFIENYIEKLPKN
ncbi:MAG: F0F1 ATP synthase subunit B [Candidatus Kapabacteria bacterium]|nr:F0F1 ATP synthase subunit B [Candidatus Kapabacteria bacterium]